MRHRTIGFGLALAGLLVAANVGVYGAVWLVRRRREPDDPAGRRAVA